jgi:hypothetical protein
MTVSNEKGRRYEGVWVVYVVVLITESSVKGGQVGYYFSREI